jgi:hypothetical protein
MLCTNALVFVLVEALEGEGPAQRAPAVLAIPDALIDRLLGASRAPRAPELAGGARSIGVQVRPGPSLARISADVERQYLRALFEAAQGDLDRMAAELLGPGASGRRVHLRMNQLGLRLREMRGSKA